MTRHTIEVHGTVQPDGSLRLDERLELPAGRVRVTVQPLMAAADPARFQAMMDHIWTGQKTRGHRPRTKEQIDAEIKQLRQEAEDELQAAERLHDACQGASSGGQE